MELLIPGLILVALMIYASTRIKRSAARAFEAETIETDDFVIEKPEGFLNVIGGDPKFAFEAYSKEYGGEGAENIRLATANVTFRPATSINDAAKEILSGDGEVIYDRNAKIGGINYRLIERVIPESGLDFRVRSKLAEQDGKVIVLTIRSIAQTTPEVMRNIEAMFDSFELK